MENKNYPIGGFAPGYYSNKCVSCEKEFMGDKLARQCEPCAVAMVKLEEKYSNTIDNVEILNEFTGYEIKWVCKYGHTNFKTVLGKGSDHDICLTCGKHYNINIK